MHSSSNFSEVTTQYYSSSFILNSQKNYALLDYLYYKLSLLSFSSHFAISFAEIAISSYYHSKYKEMDNHIFNFKVFYLFFTSVYHYCDIKLLISFYSRY